MRNDIVCLHINYYYYSCCAEKERVEPGECHSNIFYGAKVNLSTKPSDQTERSQSRKHCDVKH